MKKRFMDRFLKKSSEDEIDIKNSDDESKEMIRGIIELSNTIVKEIMVPRTDVVFLSINTPVEQVLKVMSECGHSRVPVYDGTIDNVTGILYNKDVLSSMVKHKTIEIKKIMRKPYFVPDSKKLNSLLKEFKNRKVHIAVVVDEYGGTSGIVCMEDIIEEVVGKIQDEFDNETDDIVKVSDNIYLCDARANLYDINEQIALGLPEESFDTLGGFVYDLLGKIPVKYEKVSYKNIDFIIQDIIGHKIESVKIIINKPDESENTNE